MQVRACSTDGFRRREDAQGRTDGCACLRGRAVVVGGRQRRLRACSPPSFTHTPTFAHILPTLASSLVSTRSPFVHGPPPRRSEDEDFINRSLLDSLDAQADAEPTSSSDSEAPAAPTSFGSLSASSSIGSVQFHITPQPLHRSDSPSHYIADSFKASTMYNNVHHSDFSSDLDPQKHSKIGEYVQPGPFRTSTAFNAFNSNSRSRQASLPVTSTGAHTFRDTSNFSQHYPGDVFATAQPSIQSLSSPQSQSHQSANNNTFEAMHGPRGAFDFGPGSAQQGSSALGSGHSKPVFSNVDPFGNGGPGQSLLSSHKPGGMVAAPGQPQGQGAQAQAGFQQVPFMNGMHQQNMRSQTPYGPHLPASASALAVGQGQGAPGHAATNGAPQQAAQEEISTIFVVGFPEDMQEREFQNMFTFSAGFEAATLKIPNKELTAYGSGGVRPGPGGGPLGYMQTHGGANDPYNLVTINQGGVVVDNGRDGTTSSWQPTTSGLDSDAHLVNNPNPNLSTRKQIIGFAKFRTRKEALEARDALQGRRVDIEKGAVLKAEMAKKNLHTKRGIGIGAGSLGGQLGLAGIMGATGNLSGEALANLQGIGNMQPNGIHGLGVGMGMGSSQGADVIMQREKELATLGAMGFVGGLGARKEMQDERAFAAAATRGARERAEEEERKWKVEAERERDSQREKERSARLRSRDAFAFDAFHSVPPSSQAVGNSLLAATAGSNEGAPSGSGTPGTGNGTFAPRGSVSSPWGFSGRDMGVALNGALRKASNVVGSGLPARPLSPNSQQASRQSSPPNREVNAFAPPPGLGPGSFSPPSQAAPLPSHPSLPSRPRAYSPTGASASASSVGDSVSVGERETSDEEIARSLDNLAVSTQSVAVGNMNAAVGSTSPQLPSPASGISSGGGSAGGKSASGSGSGTSAFPPPPGMPPNYLEESLRELFSKRPGFRKLCFRQKSNGPMCFVEFCDVQYATKALNDLYGATLNGLIKGGGIRLSYSKNPLGIRTPTNGQSQQQQASGSSAFPSETFQPRTLAELDMGMIRPRRDNSGVTSPTSTSSYQFSVSPPPPRFVSPPPGPGSFNAAPFGRSSQAQNYGFGPASSMSMSNPPSSSSSFASFSPFVNSTSPHPHAFTPIPEQTSSTPIGTSSHDPRNIGTNINSPTSNLTSDSS
ncbi:hypothetical protein EVG20_g9601 [Dentipellis fragilis]|uniref:RRM domain-containing protein n=1 Tax=Dentipellis fragilis TaxID=205917 RepID=A0A4Y9XY36_9AGAM|nr:hypothetical protein EVG20_g9601 [Dentipellis fragilis]